MEAKDVFGSMVKGKKRQKQTKAIFINFMNKTIIK